MKNSVKCGKNTRKHLLIVEVEFAENLSAMQQVRQGDDGKFLSSNQIKSMAKEK